MMFDSPHRIYLNALGPCNFPFDIDQLHDQLSSSFRANGIQHHAVADDILIALQHVLLQKNFKIRSDADLDQIHAMLVKVLQDNGFPEVAEHFAQTMRDSSINFLTSKIQQQFQQTGEVFTPKNCQNVLNKILTLNYPTEEISPLLIREICLLELKLNQSKSTKITSIPSHESLPLEKQYVDWNWEQLQIRYTGSIFTALRIDIFPLEIAKELEMTVFMEMIFLNAWEKLLTQTATHLNNCLDTIKDNGQKPIDYLNIVIYQQEEFYDFCQLNPKSNFTSELHKLTTSIFGDLLKKFTSAKISANSFSNKRN